MSPSPSLLQDTKDDLLQRLRVLLEKDPSPAPQHLAESFLRAVSDNGLDVSIVDPEKLSRSFRPDLANGGKGQVVRWSNVRFHWARIAGLAATLGESLTGGNHAAPYWFLKVFQLFLQLRGIRALEVSEQAGMTYWALWTHRDVRTSSIRKSHVAPAMALTFTTWHRSTPSAADTLAALNELEGLRCVRIEPDVVLLLETVEIKL